MSRNATGGTTAEYIFFGGKRIAMLPAGSNPLYYVEDLLGTSRVVAQSNGAVCYDADFYPYGGERTVTNTCPQNNYKFEGKERDTETGNDDFGARYYSNRFGRWLSADWSAVPVPVPYANLTNPQILNLYAMVADDPESFADLDGHDVWDRIKQLGRATLNIGVGIVKLGAVGALGAATPATGGASAFVAAYTAVSASGNFAAAGIQLAGVVTGDTKGTEKAAQTATAVTSGLGFVTLLATGGDVDKASTAAAYEGMITTNPADLAKGNSAVQAIKAIDYANTAKDAAQGTKQLTAPAPPPPHPPAPKPPTPPAPPKPLKPVDIPPGP